MDKVKRHAKKIMNSGIVQNKIARLSFVIVFAVLATILIIHSHAQTPTAGFEAENGTLSSGATTVTSSSASGGAAVQFGTVTPPPTGKCVVTALLVNPCRAWLGAASGDHPGDAGLVERMTDHESRIGRKLDVVHDYLTPGKILSADDKTLATRPNTFLMLNWKPANTWANADGSDDAVNTQIDNMAKSIKAIAPTRIFLAVYHEPENDVSSGNCAPNAKNASAGSPAQYVSMWHNVRARFNAEGVNNVVWTMNYMGYKGWDCLVDDLWPGNSYVDWVVWDPYGHNGDTFDGTIGGFYNELGKLSDADHDYNSKVWGINEYGDQADYAHQSDVYNFYAQGVIAVDKNTFPKIKMWNIFDNLGALRVNYTDSTDPSTKPPAPGKADPTEQNDYNKFANDSNLTSSFTDPY